MTASTQHRRLLNFGKIELSTIDFTPREAAGVNDDNFNDVLAFREYSAKYSLLVKGNPRTKIRFWVYDEDPGNLVGTIKFNVYKKIEGYAEPRVAASLFISSRKHVHNIFKGIH